MTTKVIGLDIGKKRIGIAMSDIMGLIAHPVETISREPEKSALEKIQSAWLENKDSLPSELEVHEIWYKKLREKYSGLGGVDKIKAMLRDEVGHVFAQVLRDSGVYKRDTQGFAAFDKFAESVLK